MNVLTSAIQRVVGLCTELQQSGTVERIVLVELPLGNSVPVRLLEHSLRRQGTPVDLLWIAAGRNGSPQLGPTRKGIFLDRLRAFKLTRADIVVLMDEWNKGVSFRTHSAILSEHCNKAGVRFLPIGLLTHAAESSPGHKRNLKHHDDLCSRASIPGTSMRFVFPSINLRGAVCSDRPFFWVEHDRLAGYRKTQLLGSHLSALYFGIKKLQSDTQALGLAASYLVEESDDHSESDLLLRGGASGALHEVFTNSCAQVEEWYRQASSLELPSNFDSSAEFEPSLADLVALIEPITRSLGLMPAARLALSWLTRHGLDAGDPYHFKHHVPLTLHLTGDDLLLNQCFVRCLIARLEAQI